MVYIIKMHVDGGCRGNGKPGSIGAAAVCWESANGRYRTMALPRKPAPTNQRAEIQAIIMALEWVLEIDKNLRSNPYLKVTIYSDSQYAVNCMNNWRFKWYRNGWVNSQGYGVANQDLIKKADRLADLINDDYGEVSFVWIPREDNQEADRCCNEVLDDLER